MKCCCCNGNGEIDSDDDINNSIFNNYEDRKRGWRKI